MDDHQLIKKVGLFLLDILLASILFIAIAAGAVLLSELIDYLETHKVNKVITSGLQIAEYSIFVVDLALFLVYLARTAIDLVKAIWKR